MSQPCSCSLLHNYHFLTNSSPLFIRKIASEVCRFHPRDASVHFCCLQPGHISLSQYSPRGLFVFTFCHMVRCSASYCSHAMRLKGSTAANALNGLIRWVHHNGRGFVLQKKYSFHLHGISKDLQF